MSLLAFADHTTDFSQALSGSHQPLLVLLSLLIAILAAHTSFNFGQLMRSTRSIHIRRLWHGLGAIALGGGVWAMHFTGMMAFELPVQVDYQLGATLLSIVPAVLAAAVILHVVAMPKIHWRGIVLGGFLMGAGIGIMHYTGMAAMVLQAERLYRLDLFIVSVLVAVVLATLALSVRPLLRPFITQHEILKLISAVVMGLAIASMHYLAMHATLYLPAETIQGLSGVHISKATLGALAVMVAVGLLVIAAVAVRMRQRLQHMEKESSQSERMALLWSQRMQRISERVPGLVYQFKLSSDGRFTFPYASEAIRDIYRISPQQAALDASRVMDVIHPDDREGMLRSIERSAADFSPWNYEYRVLDEQGNSRWVLGNSVPEQEADGISWFGFITDITERKAADETIHRLAYYDELTGLYNRKKILLCLQELLQEMAHSGYFAAVIYLDLDDFKRLNDTLGHQAGDQLLMQVAHRIAQEMPTTTFCGRLSSDEFVMVLGRLPAIPTLARDITEQQAEQLLVRLQQPFAISGHQYNSSVSVGVYTFSAEEQAEECLKRADLAMSYAKQAGGSEVRFFDPQMLAEVEQRFELEQAISRALVADEFMLFYQPQLTEAGQVIAVEALIRWRHPQWGMISPAYFIPLAEESSQIEAIGHWVLQQACLQLQRWQQQPRLADLCISVNISVRQFYQPDFVRLMSDLLARYQVDPAQLTLELTESLVLTDLDDAVHRMQQLKALGLRFAMDDFGTGYSSLSYLSRLPFDEVKIDQHFVRQSEDGEKTRDWAIVEAIIGIANTFGMALVAEGVETEAQRQLLLASGCYCFQGYLFAKPQAVADFESWFSQR
ncbi:EAL domain-containing protein [Alkalimonas amylolytica]|uniref:PAS domain S-box-containing protein/diguanylate cyclase (GGDEF) domain-containing protein n=1 Tax=Alkalimonas amylolytica TaxID=152573 RepID=A0A1H4BQJ0_ALKAM|nr:EAL domain-containing protein [Alkalimonas amylolytica]SEA50340.1 PAS domain S-box-containing protein/diguanylate cyclase (GGDEF) domain-containing protein [Alkalimonas amylolytica]